MFLSSFVRGCNDNRFWVVAFTPRLHPRTMVLISLVFCSEGLPCSVCTV